MKIVEGGWYKIKTWERLEKEFGKTACGEIKVFWPFTQEMDFSLPKNRIILAEVLVIEGDHDLGILWRANSYHEDVIEKEICIDKNCLTPQKERYGKKACLNCFRLIDIPEKKVLVQDSLGLINKSNRKFKDISSEEYRYYIFKDQEVVSIDDPCWLSISKSGHYILDKDGLCHFIPFGWLELCWKAKGGAPYFVL
jgi:hypothetical protein